MPFTQLACVLLALASSQEWTRFRGPMGAGIRPAPGLSATFSNDSIVWRVPVGGGGHSSPVLWGDRLFLTRETEQEGRREVVCFDAESGKELWTHGEEFQSHPQHRFNSYASATPTVDADGVYVSWISGEVVCALALDHDGKPLWSSELGSFAAQHGGGNSAVLFEDLLIVANEHEAEGSFLKAVDKKNGETRWTIQRETRERRGSYACPILHAPEGRAPMLLFASTAHGLTAVDPRKGEVLWEADIAFKDRCVGVPAISGDNVILTGGTGNSGKESAVVRMPKTADEEPVIAYRPRRSLPYVPGQLALGGRFYLIADGGIASCLDAASGDVLWTERLDGTFFSSPVSNGAVIYVASREGQLLSIAPGSTFGLLGTFDLGAPMLATPAIAGDRMYVRTSDHLVCLK